MDHDIGTANSVNGSTPLNGITWEWIKTSEQQYAGMDQARLNSSTLECRNLNRMELEMRTFTFVLLLTLVGCASSPELPEHIRPADINKDGWVSESESQAWFFATAPEFDADDNGMLDGREAHAAALYRETGLLNTRSLRPREQKMLTDLGLKNELLVEQTINAHLTRARINAISRIDCSLMAELEGRC